MSAFSSKLKFRKHASPAYISQIGKESQRESNRVDEHTLCFLPEFFLVTLDALGFTVIWFYHKFLFEVKRYITKPH